MFVYVHVNNKLLKFTSKTYNNIRRLKSASYFEILDKVLTGEKPEDIDCAAENVVIFYEMSTQGIFNNKGNWDDTLCIQLL